MVNTLLMLFIRLEQASLKLKKYDLKVFIVYRQRYQFSKHWIPFIIHKLDNQINLHIVDSFESTWYGDDLVNQIEKKING